MIEFNDKTKMFFLDGKNITYAMFVNDRGFMSHLYFGEKIPHDDIRYTRIGGGQSMIVDRMYQDFAPEISFFGTGDYREATVALEDERGSRLTELLYAGYDILDKKPAISGMPSLDGGETLVIHLADSVTGFAADMYYTVYDDCDVLARRIVYKNGTASKIRLDRAYSFALQLPENDYEITSLYGVWAKERHLQKTQLHHGVVSIDSKRVSSSAVLNPFMGVSKPNATEESGEVWGISLVYSSSFVLKAQKTPAGDAIFTGGINDFDFAWTLEAGESFETPEAVIAYSSDGFGGMSRAFHDAFREHIINKKYVYAKRPIVINNWEGTSFNFDEEKLKSIIDGISNTGVDTFVLDDGWFGVRDNDKSGLGDWDIINPQKLPNGLKGISDYAHSKNMKFGLWFEPEMVSEDSELYRKHPDFAIKAFDRPHCHGRNQCMLDITRADVRDYIVNVVNKVIRENGIDYVKWDCNRSVTEFVSIALPAEKQKEFAHRYALGLYDMCERIINGNPDVFFEGCSSGGARFDAAMLYYFPQIWTSDDSDAEERTFIQHGTSMLYPLSSMSCHVTKSPNHQVHRETCMQTRGDIAHLGATGYELDSSSFTDADRDAVRAQVKEYKEWNEQLVLTGDLYRIENPFGSNFFAQAVVSKDKSRAVLVCYRRMGSCNNEMKHIVMRGLDENKRYRVYELDGVFSGKTLMRVGVVPQFTVGDFKTVKYHFEEI